MNKDEILPFDADTNAALLKFADKMGCESMGHFWQELSDRTPEFEARLNAAGYEYVSGTCIMENGIPGVRVVKSEESKAE